jgi:hypothetical protein
MAEKEVAHVQAEPVSTEQSQAPSVSLQDLILVAQIIQPTSQRGAFRAEELANVGTLYNKLVAFLESTGAVSRTAPEGQTEEKQND